MGEGQAKIIVGASEVAGDRRHTYLLFENSAGQQIVVRGGPDARSEGNDLANFAESTVLGSRKFGNIVVEAAPYVAPYDAYLSRQGDGSIVPVRVQGADPADPSFIRDDKGKPIIQPIAAPDWQMPGEHHERKVVWAGTDAELQQKLEAAGKAGQQINDAKLEYSPLNNNSNGVTSNLLKAADVAPSLPLGKDNEPVKAPNFGETLYQNVGIASHRSGYSFDGKHWRDDDGKNIQPPISGQKVVPIQPPPDQKGAPGSLDSRSSHAQLDPALMDPIKAGVHGIDASLGRAPDANSERMTMSLYALAKDAGMTQVDHVLLSCDGTQARAGENVFVVQGALDNPAHLRAHMPTAQAISTPIEQSLQQAADGDQQRLAELRSNSPQVSQDPTVQAQAVHSMRV